MDVNKKIQFNFLDLPEELQIMIIKLINDTSNICKCRLVCRKWYLLWQKVPNIEDNLILGYHNFTPKSFSYLDLSGNLIREIKFKSYGRWIYQEYSPDSKVIRTIQNTDFFTTTSDDNTDIHYRRILKVDARAGLVKETKIPKLMLAPQCIIS